jgi:hypothetical protein
VPLFQPVGFTLVVGVTAGFEPSAVGVEEVL